MSKPFVKRVKVLVFLISSFVSLAVAVLPQAISQGVPKVELISFINALGLAVIYFHHQSDMAFHDREAQEQPPNSSDIQNGN